MSGHRSRILKREDIMQAHRVYGMTARHVSMMHDMLHPAEVAAQSIATLGEEVPDPWHEPLAAYEATAKTLLAVIPNVLSKDFPELGGGT